MFAKIVVDGKDPLHPRKQKSKERAFARRQHMELIKTIFEKERNKCHRQWLVGEYGIPARCVSQQVCDNTHSKSNRAYRERGAAQKSQIKKIDNGNSYQDKVVLKVVCLKWISTAAAWHQHNHFQTLLGKPFGRFGGPDRGRLFARHPPVENKKNLFHFPMI